MNDLTSLSLVRCKVGGYVPPPPTNDERMRAFHLAVWRAQFGNTRFLPKPLQAEVSSEEKRNEQP